MHENNYFYILVASYFLTKYLHQPLRWTLLSSYSRPFFKIINEEMYAGHKGKMWEFNVQGKKEFPINIITSLPDLEIPFTNSWNSTRN